MLSANARHALKTALPLSAANEVIGILDFVHDKILADVVVEPPVEAEVEPEAAPAVEDENAPEVEPKSQVEPDASDAPLES